MKKRWGIVLATALAVGTLWGCSSGNQGTSQPESTSAEESAGGNETESQPEQTGENTVQADGMLWDVKPLENRTSLTMSYLANSTPALTTYIADRLGWLDACNLDVEMIYFAGGPAQMEGSGSWEVGTTGIGGVITGIINYDIEVLGIAAQDKGLFQAFFARKDSPIVQDGQGYGEFAEVYGKPESWKGTDILTAVGTTNQYALYRVLKSLGLSLEDVNIINMDIAAATTAFLAGEGDVAGVQGTMIFDEEYQKEDSDYVMVASDQIVHSGLDVNYVATQKALAEKPEAVEAWLELALMAGEWANANPDQAAEMITDLYAEDGYETDLEANKKTLVENPFTSLADNYTFFTEKSEDGERIIAEDNTYQAMEGYIEMGNYSQEQSDQLFAAGNYNSSLISNIYGRQ